MNDLKKTLKSLLKREKYEEKNNNTVKIDVNAEKNDGIIELIH